MMTLDNEMTSYLSKRIPQVRRADKVVCMSTLLRREYRRYSKVKLRRTALVAVINESAITSTTGWFADERSTFVMCTLQAKPGAHATDRRLGPQIMNVPKSASSLTFKPNQRTPHPWRCLCHEGTQRRSVFMSSTCVLGHERSDQNDGIQKMEDPCC